MIYNISQPGAPINIRTYSLVDCLWSDHDFPKIILAIDCTKILLIFCIEKYAPLISSTYPPSLIYFLSRTRVISISRLHYIFT